LSTAREVNRSFYHAEAYRYPLALFCLPDGRTGLVQCPAHYNRLEIEEAATGELLTGSGTRAPADVFHSRLAVSDSGRYLLSAGWIWHPWSCLMVHDLAGALADPTRLDSYGDVFDLRGLIIDYMRGGMAPPQFPGIARPPAQQRQLVLSDGRVPHPNERVYRPDASRLTNAQRRDHCQVERDMVRQQLAAEENEVTSWDAVNGSIVALDNTVKFGRSPVDAAGGLRGGRPQYAVTNPAALGVLYRPMPDYMAAAAARSVRTVQPRQDRGPQRVPTITN